MAVNVNRSFKEYGWCTAIRGVESGGAVEGLPVHTFPSDDGGVDMTCPTEIAISDRREMELANSGLMPLVHRKNTDIAAFIGAQSLQKPTEYTDPDATDEPPRNQKQMAIADSLREAFTMALFSMTAHKMRTFLTMLGIAWGDAVACQAPTEAVVGMRPGPRIPGRDWMRG